MEITIEPIVKEACPAVQLGLLHCQVEIKSDYPELISEIEKANTALQQKYRTEDITHISPIANGRKAYRALGKEPARYRLSAEALTRRVLNGKGLYQINNVVDTLNLVSLKTGFSIGGYDFEKIEGAMILGVGKKDEPYEAIGRGTLNIESLPLLRDDLGAFGSPTSDSKRTMITEHTRQFLMVFFAFGGSKSLEAALDMAADYLKSFAKADQVSTKII